MLGHALANTFADLSTGVGYVLLGIAAWVLLSLIAGAAWCLAAWFFGFRPAKRLREAERERFAPVDFAAEIRVHDRTRRGPDCASLSGRRS
jgi:hypothetical protein